MKLTSVIPTSSWFPSIHSSTFAYNVLTFFFSYRERERGVERKGVNRLQFVTFKYEGLSTFNCVKFHLIYPPFFFLWLSASLFFDDDYLSFIGKKQNKIEC